MPTPLTPDEEFDAQFRLGLEHYPEQPEDPAAWHRMDLLLDADLRQRALRRRVLRLLGAEAVLLLIGVWAMLSFLQTQLPMADGRPTLAKTTRAKASASGTKRTVAATATQAQATEKAGASKPLSLLSKQPAMAQPNVVLHAPELSIGEVESRPATRRSTLLAAIPHSRRPHNAVSVDEQTASRASFARAKTRTGTRHLLSKTVEGTAATRNRRASADKLPRMAAESITATTSAKTNNLVFYRGKRRLHQSDEAIAQGLATAAGRQKAIQKSAAAAPEEVFQEARNTLISRHKNATSAPGIVASRAAKAAAAQSTHLPIDLLAPRWPVSGLHFQLPDSLALLALTPRANSADSLNQPKPRPLLSAYRFRVGLVGAPELSTVRADRLSKPGSSLGVMLEYQLGRRWRVSAGYLYTNKLYVARGTDYTLPAGYMMPHGYVISNVDAACRIVDIPLNLRYDLWQRPSYQVFASVGLSSLLMRREQYTYDYELLYGKPVAPYSWELDNGSNHVLKVLNLSAGYERAVGQRWTVQAEPFVKLPLAGIGFGAVRLSSAGVFFSLKYGLLPVHPAPKPR